MKGLLKMIGKILLGLIAVLVIVIGIFILVCVVTGSGKIKQFTDDNGNVLENSVAEKIYLDVNGIKNGMIIRGKNTNNPVMLFISGGPGVPQYWMNETYKNNIEDDFTVCWWDYRGEGLSYDSKINPNDITKEQLTADAEVIVNYLKERFGVEKVYLMAHSGGTMLGLNIAKKHPELVYCYFGMGQVANEGYGRHEAGYYFMKDIFEKNGDTKNLKKLESMIETVDGHIVLNKKYHDGHWEGMLLKAGCATTRDMKSDATGIFFPQMFSHCYTLSEKINYWKGKSLLSKSVYFDEASACVEDFSYEVPVIFLSGTYDYTTPISDVGKLYEKIDSDGKAFYEFKNSAHSPLWEENEKAMEVIKSHLK